MSANDRNRVILGLTLACFMGGVTMSAAWADDDPPADVGRIAVTRGAVSARADALADWVAGYQNYPLAAGGAISVAPGGLAVVDFGAARIVIDGGTEVDVTTLDDNNLLLTVPQGRIDLSLHAASLGVHYDVVGPVGQAEFRGDGTYRVHIGAAGENSDIAVFGGHAVFQAGNPVDLADGEALWISGDVPPHISVHAAIPDALDRHVLAEEHARYVRPVPEYVPNVPGAQSLSQYGAWRDVPDYGYVWVPTAVPADWAPYRSGHWAYIAPWGYTWCDDAPWGFAPFHYGRWVQIGYSWAWIPGERGGGRPAYAPALVSFVGDPAALTIGLGGAAVIGWVALGPHESYHPWYQHSEDYGRRINPGGNYVADSPQTPHDFVNRRAVTVVPEQAFRGGHGIAAAAVHLPAASLTRPLAALAGAAVLTQVLKPPTPPAPAHPVFEPHPRPGFERPPIGSAPQPAVFAPRPPQPAPTHQHEAGPVTPHAQPVQATPPISPRPLPNATQPARPAVPVQAPILPQRVPPIPRPQPQPAQPAPQMHPVQPAPQMHQAQPAPQVHQAQPAPQVHPVQPAPQVHPVQPAPQVHQAQPAPQMHQVQPAPQIHPVQAAPQPQPHPQPAPQAHPVSAPHPAPAAHQPPEEKDKHPN